MMEYIIALVVGVGIILYYLYSTTSTKASSIPHNPNQNTNQNNQSNKPTIPTPTIKQTPTKKKVKILTFLITQKIFN